MSPPRSSLILALTPFLFASKCKNKDEEVVPEEIIEVARPESKIQVLGMEPEKVDAATSFSAVITGMGFQDGASVMLGLESMPSVVVENENMLSVEVSPMNPGTYDVYVENPDGVGHTLRAGLIVRELEPELSMDCRDLTVYFDLDKSSLTADSQDLLMAKSECFTVQDVQIRVEGHCDERGTTEYNIALGQRRADATKQYLLAQGVLSSVIETVSYGEERPVVQGSNEDAWAKNRRAEIIISD